MTNDEKIKVCVPSGKSIPKAVVESLEPISTAIPKLNTRLISLAPVYGGDWTVTEMVKHINLQGDLINQLIHTVNKITNYLIPNSDDATSHEPDNNSWISFGRDPSHTRYYRCFKCNKEIAVADETEFDYKFCPYCGYQNRHD